MAQRPRGKLDRSDWLLSALTALEEGGLEAVKVLPLARALGASRGSFYWHFRDRADLLRSVLDYWEVEFTDAVLERAEGNSGSPRARLLALLEDVLERRRGRFDPAVRAWAMHDRDVAGIVRRVDRKRVGFTTGLFQEMGFPTAEARARGRLILAYLVGDHMVFVPEAPTERRNFLRLRNRLFTAR